MRVDIEVKVPTKMVVTKIDAVRRVLALLAAEGIDAEVGIWFGAKLCTHIIMKNVEPIKEIYNEE